MLNGMKRRLKKCIRRLGRTEYVTIPVLSGELLKEKTVLITGGGSGIGLAIAKACVGNQANVIICGRSYDKLKKACSEIEGNVEAYVLDISDRDLLCEQFQKIVSETGFGKIDILINNAGISKGAAFPNTEYEDLTDTLDTNVKGTYMLSELFAQYLIQRKIQGNLLNICSTSGNRPAITPYMISKWSEIGFTKGLAKKLIPYGIVVNGLAPGPTAAGMLAEAADGDLSYEKSPAGRYVTSEEVANMAVVLISGMGRMIVGETIFISGGCGTLTLDDIGY